MLLTYIARCISLSDHIGDLVVEFASAADLGRMTRTSGLTRFVDHIVYILLTRTEKQMVWIDARSNVATMEHLKCFVLRYAVCDSIRKSVGRYEDSIGPK